MFKPTEEQVKNMWGKRRSLELLKEIYSWHRVGNKIEIKEMEESEILFSHIIQEFGAEDGIKQRFIESGSKAFI